MPFGKRIAGKTLHLPPNIVNERSVTAFFKGLNNEGVACLGELVASTKLAAHTSSEHICFAEIEPCEMVRDLDHVLLVDHDPIRFGHELQEHGMRFFPFFRMAMPFDVGPHHPAARNPWPNDRARRYQTEVGVNAQLPHEHSHGGRFDIKTTNGQRFTQQMLNLCVRFEPLHIMDVDACGFSGVMCRNEVDGVTDFP